MSKRLHTLCLLAALFGLLSCEHKELCLDHPHGAAVRITFDWTAIGSHALPEGMRVAFYPAGGGEPWLFACPGGRDRLVELPAGRYRVLCYNNDTEEIVWKNADGYNDLTADTPDATAPDGASDCLTPDWLCGDHSTGIVDLSDLQPGTETEVHFTPVPMVCTYTFEVNGIRGLKYIADLRGSLSDMCGSLNMAADCLPEDLSECLLFGGTIGREQIKGGFYTFGPGLHDPAHAEAHIFKLYLKSHRGKVYTLEADVTEQINRVPLEGHLHDVHLVVDFDYDVPEEPIGGGGGGFDPGVDDWDDVNEEIIL